MTTGTDTSQPQPTPKVERVLAVVGAERSDDLIGAAAELAARHDARLHVLSCIEPLSDAAALARAIGLDRRDVLERMVAHRRGELEAELARIAPAGAATLRVTVGKAYIEVIRHVIASGIDVVVKYAERLSGLRGLVFASSDQHLLRKCPCPVWLLLPETRRIPQTIIAAVDVDVWDAGEPETLDDVNRRVVQLALKMASGSDAIVHVLHAWDAPAEGLVWAFSADDGNAAADRYLAEIKAARRQAMERLLSAVSRPSGPHAPVLRDRLVRGSPRAVLAEQARELSADALVIGTVARTGLSGVIIGNTAEDVMNTVPCSIVAVKPAHFVSPIADALSTDGTDRASPAD